MAYTGRQYKADLALLAVAAVWGFTFVVVKDALANIGPYYFLAIRFFLAAVFLGLLYHREMRKINRPSLLAGFFIGVFLFGGYALQTVGLQYTGAANAGFITGLSVVLVPLFYCLGARRLPSFFLALGVGCATLGLGLLSLQGELELNRGDVLVFFCAISFALHILAVGRYSSKLNPVVLATVQIATVALLSLIFGLALEEMPRAISPNVWWALLITAVPATSLAFLIQNKVQRYTSASHTAIIFTMEPVFAAAAAFFIAGEILTYRQLLGCGLILAGMLVAEYRPDISQYLSRGQKSKTG